MSKLTPQEILRTIAQDFKRYGITYEQAAEVLGYTNKQTVANILSSKKDRYMPPEQAKRFADKCGYDIYTLMTGEGTLVFNPPVTIKAFSTRDPDGKSFETNSQNGLNPEDEIALLDQYLQAVCSVFGDPRALQLYLNYKTRVHGQTNSILAGGLTMNAQLVQNMLLQKYGPDSKEANTDPVIVMHK